MIYHSPFETEIDKFNNLTLNDLTTKNSTRVSNFCIPLSQYNSPSVVNCIYSNTDLKDSIGNVVHNYNKPAFVNPFFLTTQEELSSGKFDILKIDAGSLDYYEDSLVLNIYDLYDMGDGVYSDYIKKSFLLDSSSSYFTANNLQVYYYIPQSNLGIDISNGKRYKFELKEKGGNTVYSSVTFEVGGLTTEEEIKNTEGEQLETSKGIWETIKELLSYINPFSENFFAYKLVDLIIQGFQGFFDMIGDFFSKFWSTDYDEEDVTIDDGLSSDIDESTYTNFITDLIESIDTAVTGDWSTVEEVEIPFGIVDASVTYKSDMISSHIPNVLILLINTFWMFLFGMYIFKFALNLVNWLKSGDILEGGKFGNNEVITSTML